MRRTFLCLLAPLGFLLGYPNPIFFCPIFALLYPLGIALLGNEASNYKEAFRYAWLSGLLGHTTVLYWVVVPLSTVGGMPLFAAVPCMLIICLVLALHAGIFSLASKALWQKDSLVSPLCLGLLWFLLEISFAELFGFPWLPLAGALVAWPALVQVADSFGVYLTSGIWVATILYLAHVFFSKKILPLATGIVMLSLLLGYAGFSLYSNCPEERLPQGKDSFPVLFVEGNIDQNQKWDAGYREVTLAKYSSLSRKAVRNASDPDLANGLMLWSETAMPFFFAESTHSLRISQLVQELGISLLTGAPGRNLTNLQSKEVYNRAWLISPEGKPVGHYDKEHLVPFGEYLPEIASLEVFKKLFSDLYQEIGTYTPGKTTKALRIGNLALGTLICYEGIFPSLAQARVEQGANILVDISNDAWFGESSAPLQHLYLSALRSIEQNRWLLRGTNTGISCIIDSRGRLVFHGEQFKATTLYSRARTVQSMSLYHQAQPFLPAIATLILAFLCGYLYWKDKKKCCS